MTTPRVAPKFLWVRTLADDVGAFIACDLVQHGKLLKTLDGSLGLSIMRASRQLAIAECTHPSASAHRAALAAVTESGPIPAIDTMSNSPNTLGVAPGWTNTNIARALEAVVVVSQREPRPE